MRKITEVLFDMDGVMVNNMLDLASREGITVEEIIRRKKEMKKMDADFDYVMHLIRKYLYTHRHFANSPAFAHIHEIKRLMRHMMHNGVSVKICSSATSGDDIYTEVVEQKKEWLDAHGLGILPAYFSRGAAEKKNYAKPHVLLIDDYERNVSQFIEAGGHAIQFECIHKLSHDLQEFGLL